MYVTILNYSSEDVVVLELPQSLGGLAGEDFTEAVDDILSERGYSPQDINYMVTSDDPDEDKFALLVWPSVQEYMDKDGFDDNAFLVQGLGDVENPVSYMVRCSWLRRNTK